MTIGFLRENVIKEIQVLSKEGQYPLFLVQGELSIEGRGQRPSVCPNLTIIVASTNILWPGFNLFHKHSRISLKVLKVCIEIVSSSTGLAE